MSEANSINTTVEIDDVSGPLQEIRHMADFAAGLAADGLDANEAQPGYYQIPRKEGNQTCILLLRHTSAGDGIAEVYRSCRRGVDMNIARRLTPGGFSFEGRAML
jgi:hypothetical protein